MTFAVRPIGLAGVLASPTTWTFSVSSVGDGLTPTQANMSDGDSFTYWASNYSGPPFIQADFGTVVAVAAVHVRAVEGWGPSFLNNRDIHTSSDGTTWTKQLTITGSSLYDTDTHSFSAPVAARYVRLSYSTTGAIACSELYFS